MVSLPPGAQAWWLHSPHTTHPADAALQNNCSESLHDCGMLCQSHHSVQLLGVPTLKSACHVALAKPQRLPSACHSTRSSGNQRGAHRRPPPPCLPRRRRRRRPRRPSSSPPGSCRARSPSRPGPARCARAAAAARAGRRPPPARPAARCQVMNPRKPPALQPLRALHAVRLRRGLRQDVES